MPKRKIVGYGVSSLGKDLCNIIISTYLMLFYTNILGISAFAGGMIMMGTKIWDAINDPIMGVVADNTRTRWGKYRPYVLFVPPLLAIFGVLVFIPVNFSNVGKVAWAAVTYVIMSMLSTAFNIPVLSLMPSLTKDPKERAELATCQTFFTTMAVVLGSTFVYPVIKLLGGGSETSNLAKGYPWAMVIAGIILITTGWTTFASTKEVIDTNAKENLSLGQRAKILINKPFLALTGINMLFSLGMSVGNAMGSYYVLYVLKNEGLMPVYMFAMTIAMTAITLVIPSVLKVISREMAVVLFLVISSVTNIIMFFFGGSNIILLLVLTFISSACAFAPAVIVTIMSTDVSDYTVYKSGQRVDGLLYAMNNLTVKLAQAINSGLLGILLSVCGFNAALGINQSTATISGLNFMRCIYPIIPFIGAIICALIYPLKGKALDDMRKSIQIKED